MFRLLRVRVCSLRSRSRFWFLSMLRGFIDSDTLPTGTFHSIPNHMLSHVIFALLFAPFCSLHFTPLLRHPLLSPVLCFPVLPIFFLLFCAVVNIRLYLVRVGRSVVTYLLTCLLVESHRIFAFVFPFRLCNSVS
ncbi:hypothetical protein GYMLUDRAFT_921639 [Collybiopsis luxurians FD-317 M1]|uniref:Uncharacterized protein n=1 Tax=Collybiopsis luxurians FD-317 M1 TaxID=944289 RepID=A0A0D0AU47_9AGAR|nr:hypothetical protein GYMLUDRAFT_921639 [Collybiopsis luxurians FD-317 M1]